MVKGHNNQHLCRHCCCVVLQVGDCIDFRLPSSSGSSVTGWRSGIVLAIAPGSEWEGGRRLLVKPRHTNQHSHPHSGTTPSLPPDSPAAAALAAVAAAGGRTGATMQLLISGICLRVTVSTRFGYMIAI